MKKKIAVLGCSWSTNFVKDFLKGVQTSLKDTQADVFYFNAYDFTEFSGYPNYTGYSVYNLIDYKDYDGIIVLSDLINNSRILEKERQRILKAGKPAITINKQLEGLSCIKIDNYSGEYALVNHLIKQHEITDVGYVNGKEYSLDLAERFKAYKTALADNKIALNMEKVFIIDRCDYNTAYEFFDNYLQQGKKLPQALVCANDFIAVALAKVCNKYSINVPQDIKITGFDDIIYARNANPAITTVRSNAEIVGQEAAKRVFYLSQKVQLISIKTTPVFRESCGCKNEGVQYQKTSNMDVYYAVSDIKEFQSHMEVIQEIFTDASDVFTLLTNLENYMSRSHHYEGSDFCIFLKSDWSSVLINSMENLPQNWTYGEQVQSVVSIQGNKKYAREVIDTKKIIPSKMQSEQNNLFLVMPIYNHLYVHGYFVSKNNTNILDNNNAFAWTRNFGLSIERFRKQNMFKQMSQQYLKLSTRDALSGMLNRVGLEKLAIPYYNQNKKNQLTTILFFVDINSMKHINDQFGHLHGDLAVKTVSAAVMEIVPKNWLCIRYGGDEFLVIGDNKKYNGEDYCTMIQKRIAEKTEIMRLPYNLSASVGNLSVPPDSTLTLKEAVEKVDDIMYVKKQKYHSTN